LFIFALDVTFQGVSRGAKRVEAMMRAFPSNAPDGEAAVETRQAAAALGRWNVVHRDRLAVPSWDAAAGLLFVGDVRLYNRSELISELGCEPHLDASSDLELARLAYLKWADASPNHLVGDFAFAAWNERDATLFAARDHLGVRPLYYRLCPDGIAVASDPRQILALVDRSAESINSERILAWLTRQAPDPCSTFFRRIMSVAPGNTVVAKSGGLSERRYWMYPNVQHRDRSYTDTCEDLRATFKRVVEDRLESDAPIVAHSSGGFDSSTILMAADEVYRRQHDRPRLVTISGVAPGYPSDESQYMDAVASRVCFEARRWSIVQTEPISFPGVTNSSPRLFRGIAWGPGFDLEVARQENARILLSGVLGDGVWHATGVRRDMVRHGRGVHAAIDIARAGFGGLLHRAFDAALGVLAPATANRVADLVFSGPGPPPKWLGPGLLEAFPLENRRGPDDLGEGGSHLSRAVWWRLTGPSAAAAMAGMVDYVTDDGIELRAPYADVRLVERVLAISWTQREPKGHHRRTGRDALGLLLPPIFNDRIDQPPWDLVWANNARQMAVASREFIERGPWLSAPFVNRGIARGMLRNVLHGDPTTIGCTDGILVANFGALEAWLRQLAT
jgi:Glutamine amidotransferase domain/Asparagine synthase